MALSNTEIAALFDRLADLLDIRDDNPFRVRAYRNAARVIGGHPHAIADRVADNRNLDDLPGIGEGIADRILTIVETGRLPELDDVARETPVALAELMDVPGLGPKRVKQIYRELGIRSARDLERAAQQGRLADLEGFGDKMQDKVLDAVRHQAAREGRTGLAAAEDLARPLLDHLRGVDGVKRVVIAGSYRRRKETVGDLDILVTCKRGTPVMERLRAFEDVTDVASQGETRATVYLRGGLQVDVRVVAQAAFGAALYYFTGSKAHNVAVRRIAVDNGYKLNEYGLFQGGKRIAGGTEEKLLEALGLRWMPPELREDSGEIEAAREDRLPRLLSVSDLRGDLHCHTTASDGRASLKSMAEAARGLGYEYLAITDHSQQVRVAHGLDPKRLRQHIKAIDRLNDSDPGIRVLKSCEVDILEGGRLDMPDDVLEQLDVVVATVHAHFDLTRGRQTERLLRALDHPCVHILAHPTGRLIGKRAPLDVDMARILAAAAERGCAMEVNAQPARLDLNDGHCRLAKETGVKLVISSDAHSTAGLEMIRFGVDQARRGWIEPDDVLNTRPLDDFLSALRR